MNDVKFGDMHVGDRVTFITAPGVRVPKSGIIVNLTARDVTYANGEVEHTVRRNSLVANRRERLEGGKFHWVFE